VQLIALKEALTSPEVITESSVFPITVPEREPVDMHSEPVMDTLPVTEVLV